MKAFDVTVRQDEFQAELVEFEAGRGSAQARRRFGTFKRFKKRPFRIG